MSTLKQHKVGFFLVLSLLALEMNISNAEVVPPGDIDSRLLPYESSKTPEPVNLFWEYSPADTVVKTTWDRINVSYNGVKTIAWAYLGNVAAIPPPASWPGHPDFICDSAGFECECAPPFPRYTCECFYNGESYDSRVCYSSGARIPGYTHRYSPIRDSCTYRFEPDYQISRVLDNTQVEIQYIHGSLIDDAVNGKKNLYDKIDDIDDHAVLAYDVKAIIPPYGQCDGDVNFDPFVSKSSRIKLDEDENGAADYLPTLVSIILPAITLILN